MVLLIGEYRLQPVQPEHRESCIVHPEALLTEAFEQRAKLVPSPHQDIQCTFFHDSGTQTMSHAGPRCWACPTRAGTLSMVPSLDYLVGLTRESRQLWSPSYSLSWARDQASSIFPQPRTSELQQLPHPKIDPNKQ